MKWYLYPLLLSIAMFYFLICHPLMTMILLFSRCCWEFVREFLPKTGRIQQTYIRFLFLFSACFYSASHLFLKRTCRSHHSLYTSTTANKKEFLKIKGEFLMSLSFLVSSTVPTPNTSFPFSACTIIHTTRLCLRVFTIHKHMYLCAHIIIISASHALKCK